MSIPDDITDSVTTSDHNLNPLWEVIFILVLLNKHTEVMDIELGDHDIRNVYDDYVYVQDYLRALREYKLINDFHLDDTVLFLDLNAYLYLGSVIFWLIVVVLTIFVDWMILFDLRFRFIVVVLTLIFRRGIIFDPTTTTIPVHDPNNNNNTVPYVQVHASTDSDTVTYNNNDDADTCNVDEEWYAHVFYGYLEAVGVQESKCGHTLAKFYASLHMYFI